MIRSSVFLNGFRLLFFALLIIFFGVIYDDVMYRMQDLSFFVFDKGAMHHIISRPYGYCICAARFFMQFFYHPLLGALLLALFLSGSEWILSKALRLPPRYGLLTYALPTAIAFLICAPGYGINFQYEPSSPFLWASGALLFSLAVLAVARIVCRRPKQKVEEEKLPAKNIAIQLIAAIAILSVVPIYAFKDSNFIILTKMQRQLNDYEWRKMVKTADQCKEVPSRSITAYRTMALVGLNRMGDELFRIDYEDQRIRIKGKDPVSTDESYSYMPDIHFYAGMINTANRLAVARIVFEGPSFYAIKRLVKCAVLNQDWELADKYMTILEHSLFYKNFTKKYRPLLYKNNTSFNDKELDMAFELMPVKNKYDEEIDPPFYLQYYRTLVSGKTYKSLELAMSACLYSKGINEFLEFVEFIPNKKSIPVHFQEALTLARFINNKNYNPEIKVSKDIELNVAQFLKACSTMTLDEGKAKLEKQYGKTYPYYYFYENIYKEQKNQEKTGEEVNQDGVN